MYSMMVICIKKENLFMEEGITYHMREREREREREKSRMTA